MPKQRFSRRNPCPICGGSDDAERGAGARCFGFGEGDWAHCTREEHAGGLPMNSESSTYAHRLVGNCKCGTRHDPRADTGNNGQAKSRIVATYDYRDEAGELLYQVVRFEPKSFRQRRPDGNGGWIWNLDGVRRVLYRLPEIEASYSTEIVVLDEGEKDSDNLAKVGFVATTCPQGAGKWRPEYGETLRGRHVVLIPDADPPGRRHVERIATGLRDVAASVKVIDLPGLPATKGADVSDWLALGHTGEELRALIEATETWDPGLSWFDDAAEPEPNEPDDPLDVARSVLAGIDSAESVQAALAAPETVGALARLATAERGTFEAALLKLRAGGIKAREIDALSKTVTAEQRKRPNLRLVRNGHEAEATLVRSILADAPVPAGAIVPAGWRIGAESIARERATTSDGGDVQTSLEIVAPSPIVLAGRLTYVGTHAEAIRLAWQRDRAWRHHTVERAVFANSRKLVDVAAFGLPVTSSTAGQVVDYLAAFESANLAGLPRARVSSQMGWQGKDGEEGFLWGRTLIRPDGEQAGDVRIDEVAPADWSEDWIAFRGEDSGDEQLVDGYHAAGTLAGWCEAVSQLHKYPRVLLGVYSALAAPLLLVVGAQNFVVDWSGQTTTGKSTTLRLAASCWGCPDERSPAAALSTWDASRVWIERAAAIHNGLPLILDDTKRAKNEKLVAQTIYDITQGRGRGRGSTAGTRQVSTWRTILLSSGEQKITDFSEDGGTRVRVLAVWGAPFGANAADTVNRLNAALLQNYGHAGPAFVGYLLRHRDQWPAWRNECQEMTRRYQARAGADPFAGRLAQPFALLDLATSLAHLALGWTWDTATSDVIGRLWQDIAAEAAEADRSRAALEHACLWAAEHQNQFWGRADLDHDGKPRTPATGWAGQWLQDEKQYGASWKHLAFSRSRLVAILAEAGFEPRATIRLWSDRGFALRDSEGKSTILVRLAGVPTRMVAIGRSTVEEIGLGMSARDLAGNTDD